MRAHVVSVLASILALGGCTTEALSTDEQAIIGGEVSTGDSAVVMLVGYPQNMSIEQSCTVVMISSTVGLTAAHCVDATDHPNYTFSIFPGADASAYPLLVDIVPHTVPIASVHVHPQYSPTVPFYADIATIVLQNPLPVVPLPVRRTPSDSLVGMQALIVGYGQTTYMQNNRTRHEAMTNIMAVGTAPGELDTLIIGDSTKRSCLGDSGGPAIVQGAVVGIDSYGPTGCGGPAHYRRTDFFLPFIDQYVPPPAGSDAGPQPGSDAGTEETEDGGGCSTTGASSGLLLGLALLGLRRRRR